MGGIKCCDRFVNDGMCWLNQGISRVFCFTFWMGNSASIIAFEKVGLVGKNSARLILMNYKLLKGQCNPAANQHIEPLLNATAGDNDVQLKVKVRRTC